VADLRTLEPWLYPYAYSNARQLTCPGPIPQDHGRKVAYSTCREYHSPHAEPLACQ